MADEGFDPYLIWLGIPAKDQPPNHYRLLAIELFESHPEVIENATDQRMAYLRSLQVGKHVQLSQRILNELSAAKLCLLDPGRKTEYDRTLKAKLPAAEKQVAPATATAQPLVVASALKVQPTQEATALPASNMAVDYAPARSRRKASRRGPQPGLVGGSVAGLVVVGLLIAYLNVGRPGPEKNRTTIAAAPRAQSLAERTEPTADPILPAAKSLLDNSPPALPETKAEAATQIADHPTDAPSPAVFQPPLESPDSDPSELPGKLKPPTLTVRAEALREIRAAMPDEFLAAKTPQAKAVLAAKLLALGRETTEQPATRFVLLDQARAMAVDVGEAALAEQAIVSLAAAFQIDATVLRADAEASLSRKPNRAADLSQLLGDCALLMSFDKNTFLLREGAAYVIESSNAKMQGRLEGQVAPGKGKVGPGLALGGGALVFDAPLLTSLTSYTLVFWVFPPDDHALLRLYSEHVHDGNNCGLLEMADDASLKLGAWNWSGRQSWVNAATPPASIPLNQWVFVALTLEDGGFEPRQAENPNQQTVVRAAKANKWPRAQVTGSAAAATARWMRWPCFGGRWHRPKSAHCTNWVRRRNR